MMRRLGRYFFRGLVTLLPLLLSIYVLVFFLSTVEEALRKVFFTILPWLPYTEGMGILFGLLFILGTGMAMSSSRVRRLIGAVEMPFNNVPIVKSIYSAMKDLTSYFTPSGRKKGSVVVVRFPGLSMQVVGFLTRESTQGLPGPLANPDHVAVYLPMSYQIGGYTVFVPREWVESIDMSVEMAMKSSLTAWMPGAQQNG